MNKNAIKCLIAEAIMGYSLKQISYHIERSYVKLEWLISLHNAIVITFNYSMKLTNLLNCITDFLP